MAQPHPQDAAWRYKEKLVAFLEQAITPGARVLHDVKLPVLGRPEREPRQCDVVIVQGLPPRETISIVEVQDRTSKPELTSFDGWVAKMREVGAQHLICVSALGYPDSIKNKVLNELGPTVRLVTLTESASPNMAGVVLLKVLTVAKDSAAAGPMGQFEINLDEKIFRHGEGGIAESLNDLLVRHLNARNEQEFQLPGCEPFTVEPNLAEILAEKGLYLNVDGIWHRIRSLPLSVECSIRTTRIPLITREYRQEFADDTVAWICTAEAEFPGKRLEVKIVFRPNGERILVPVGGSLAGAERLNLILSDNRTLLESVFSDQ